MGKPDSLASRRDVNGISDLLFHAASLSVGILALLAVLAVVTGCGTGSPKKQNADFFTSGSREADQRASQRMAKEEQLTGSGEGAGEKGVKKVKAAGASETASGGETNRALQAQGKQALFDRLGGEAGISNIVVDFTARALQDPRVNWDRKDTKTSRTLFHHGKSVAWAPTPENVERLQRHLIQFLSLATGGPPQYEGKEIKAVHADMKIANPEFDAAIGDLKASLDKRQVPNKEQKELLAIVESTRPLIVTER